VSRTFHSKAFKALQAKWYRRLAESGFHDVESTGPDGRLQYADGTLTVSAKRAAGSQRAEYYRRAAQWSWRGVFRSRTARRAWELHVEGLGHRAIVPRLGPMRARQQRRVLEALQEQRRAMAEHGLGADDPAPPASLHAQALEAEGFGLDGTERPARATPVVDLDRAFRRRPGRNAAGIGPGISHKWANHRNWWWVRRQWTRGMVV
jgi:hypothetical protein